jgi:hypothetical protein
MNVSRSMIASDAFCLIDSRLYYALVRTVCHMNHQGSLTLSQAMKRANKSSITQSFSNASRSAKLLKIDPVVGLYTPYIS